MKKILALTLSTMLITSAFVGCSGSNELTENTDSSTNTNESSNTSTETEVEPIDEAITIKWALWDYEQTPYYSSIIDGYKEANPNVTIETTDLGSSDYSNMLQTQMAGNSDFDVVTIKDIPGYANLVTQGHLEPLNDYISANGIDTSLYGGTVEQVTVEDKLYQLPFRSDFWLIFYNKDIFDEMGVEYPTNDITLEEYDQLARSLVHGEGNDKVYGAHYHTWRSAVQLFSILDGQHTVVDGTYDWMAPTYEMILKEQEDGIVMEYATAVSTSSHYRDLFFNRKIAMMNMGSWQIASQISAVKDGTTDVSNWGVVKYPHPEGVEAGTTLGTITGLSVSSKSENKDAALDFVAWVTGEEGAKAVAQTGTIPAIHTSEVMKSITEMEGFPQDENSIAAMETAQVYLEMPMHENAGDIEMVLNEEHAEIMNGAKSIEDGLAQMEKRIAPFVN